LSHQSLYRKYRSQTFSDLVGQNHVVRTLQNGIESGRIAHSYLFTGPRGTGKTSTARLLAKALCCEHGPTVEPDNTCEICKSITTGSCIDVIEMDAASESGVDEIRQQIVDTVEYQPMICRYKVFIIDEVHDLSAKAFDALLKTIEEPPPHIIFILATTEFNKVPPTIRSRCQKFEFHRGSIQDLTNRLTYVAEKEGIVIEPAAVGTIARMADGGYRDALTLLEQAMLTAEGEITVEHVYDQLGLVNEETVDAILMAMKERDVPTIMEQLAEVARRGRDPRALLDSMMYRLADLTRASYQVSIGAPEATAEAALHELSTRLGRDDLLRFRSGIAEAHRNIRDISLPRLWLESELIRLSTFAPAEVEAARPERTVPSVTPVADRSPAKPSVSPQVGENPTKSAAPSTQKKTFDTMWDAVVDDLTAVSKTLGMKLVGSKSVLDEPDRVVVEFSRETFCDWVREKPKVVAAIHEAVQKRKGPDCRVEFTFRRDANGGTNHSQAVELPAEGQALEKLAKRILNGEGAE
jgi:DNA polymerase-3 subunit gamma/tau